jgi:hypothetical protein
MHRHHHLFFWKKFVCGHTDNQIQFLEEKKTPPGGDLSVLFFMSDKYTEFAIISQCKVFMLPLCFPPPSFTYILLFFHPYEMN